MRWLLWLVVVCSVGALGCNPPKTPTITDGRPPLKQPPANAVGGFSLELPSVTLQPGTEAWPCVIVPLMVDGPSRMVAGATLSVGPGMHHGNILTRPGKGGGIRMCDASEAQGESQALDILAGGSVLFGSSTQINGEEWQTFPAGMAYRVKDGFEIVARMHYLNASDKPVDVAPRYQWFTVEEAAVTQEIFPFLWDYADIHLPPHTESSVTGDCRFVDSMKVVSVLPHMHKLGVSFDAGFTGGAFDGKTWLDSPGYDPENGVIQIYDPPIDLGQGSGAWFRCTWNNTFDKTIVYGVGDNEMCMLFGYGFPQAATYTTLVKDKTGCAVIAAGP